MREFWSEILASSGRSSGQQQTIPAVLTSHLQSALIRGSLAAKFILMLMVLIMLAILTLIFSAGLPPSIALILSVSVISGAAVTYWFSRAKKNNATVGIVAESDAKSEFRNKASQTG